MKTEQAATTPKEKAETVIDLRPIQDHILINTAGPGLAVYETLRGQGINIRGVRRQKDGSYKDLDEPLNVDAGTPTEHTATGPASEQLSRQYPSTAL